MLRTYKWRGVFWQFEDGKAPAGAVIVEVAPKGVTPEAPKRRTTRTRKTQAKPEE